MISAYAISVIIPVYNTEKYIKRCLDSVVNQSFKNIEIVIVDDCSPDNSHSIIESYQKNDSRIKYIKHPHNKGLLWARITGIRNATGKYILHLDADDAISLTTCDELFALAEKNEADIVHFPVYHGPSPEKMERYFSTRKSSQLRGKQILTEFLKKKIWWSSGGKFLKRSTVIKGLEFFTLPKNIHINQCEDFILFFSVCCAAKKFISDSKHGRYFYYQNDDSLTHNLFLSTERWEKVCHDFSYVRRLSLSCSRAAGLDSNEIDMLERLYATNFTWYIHQVATLPNHIQPHYAAPLLDIVHEGVAVDTKGQEFFSLLSSAIQLRKKNLPSQIKNIAIFSHSMSSGGAERVACLLANMFISIGYNVIFITKTHHQKQSYDINTNVNVHIVNDDQFRNQKLANTLKEYSIDLCIFNDHWIEQNFYDILTTQLCNIYTVCIEHNMFFYPLYTGQLNLFSLRLAAYKNTQALITLSHCQSLMWRAAGIPQSIYIQNPLTFTCSEHTRGDLPALIFVGRICHTKGIIDALHVLAEVKKSVPSVHLFVLGHFESHEIKHTVEETIHILGLTSSVSVLGRVNNVTDYYKKARILIMPSAYEGAPMVLFEAKAHAVPAVLYSMPYLSCASQADGCFMVGKHDIRGMANIVTELLQNDALWARASENALKSLHDFDNDIVLKKWTRLFHNIESRIPIIDDISSEKTDIENIIMHEFNISMNTYISMNDITNSPKYLRAIKKFVDLTLRPGSRRRYYCKIIFQYLYQIAKKIYHIYKKHN